MFKKSPKKNRLRNLGCGCLTVIVGLFFIIAVFAPKPTATRSTSIDTPSNVSPEKRSLLPKISLTDTQRMSTTADAQIVLVPTDTPKDEPTETQPPAENIALVATDTPTDEPIATQAPVAITDTPAPEGVTNAASPVVIVRVDKKAEVVTLANQNGTVQDLAGWTLRSEKGMQDCLITSAQIEPGATLNIWAMHGPDGYSCDFGKEVWNNSEADPAVLLDKEGREVARY